MFYVTPADFVEVSKTTHIFTRITNRGLLKSKHVFNNSFSSKFHVFICMCIYIYINDMTMFVTQITGSIFQLMSRSASGLGFKTRPTQPFSPRYGLKASLACSLAAEAWHTVWGPRQTCSMQDLSEQGSMCQRYWPWKSREFVAL